MRKLQKYYDFAGEEPFVFDDKHSFEDLMMFICVWESGKKNDWREDLPPEDGDYIVKGNFCGGGQMVAFRDYSKKDGWDNDDWFTVKEWMPIPDIDYLDVLGVLSNF